MSRVRGPILPCLGPGGLNTHQFGLWETWVGVPHLCVPLSVNKLSLLANFRTKIDEIQQRKDEELKALQMRNQKLQQELQSANQVSVALLENSLSPAQGTWKVTHLSKSRNIHGLLGKVYGF